MQTILNVTIPFFALVLLGYAAARSRLLPESAIPGLNAYVLFFALPSMLFRFGASMPFRQLIDPTLIGVYALCALLIVAGTLAITLLRPHRVQGTDLTNAAFAALVAAFPNSGFMGVPLLVALFGPRAAGPVIGTLLVDLFLTSTVCVALAQAHAQRHGNRSLAQRVLRSLRGAATNPQPWAIGLGALSAAGSLQLPGPAAQLLKMLADSASPVALFTIGAVLCRARQHSPGRTPVADYLPATTIKLLVHPLLVGSIGWLVWRLGGTISRFGLTVLVLAAALPSASNVSLLAERYGADKGRVARVILWSTVLAFLSFSSLAWYLGAGTP